MWSRVIEIMLGFWLWMSPFIFRHPEGAVSFWINDYTAGALCMLFGALSYGNRTRQIHLGNSVVGLWLIVFAYLNSGWPVEPAFQNNVIVGFLLLMFGIIPNHADQPSPERRRQVSAQ